MNTHNFQCIYMICGLLRSKTALKNFKKFNSKQLMLKKYAWKLVLWKNENNKMAEKIWKARRIEVKCEKTIKKIFLYWFQV